MARASVCFTGRKGLRFMTCAAEARSENHWSYHEQQELQIIKILKDASVNLGIHKPVDSLTVYGHKAV